MLFIKVSVALLVFSVLCAGQDQTIPKTGATPEQGREHVDQWLTDIAKGKPVEAAPKIAPVDGGAVNTLFTHDQFFTKQFMRYPRAVKPPGSLKLENLVRVRTGGSVERIEDVDALKKLFAVKLADTRDEKQVREVLLAFMRLVQEFYQDGFYIFAVPDQSVSIVRDGDHFVASAKAVVTKGGQGDIEVKMTTGSATNIEVTGKVRPDVRPR